MPDCTFYFDFASPNAYLAHRVIPQIEKRTNKTFEYKPILLGGLFKITGNNPPFPIYGHVMNKLKYDMIEIDRFVERYRIDKFFFNPNFPLLTLAMMRGAVWAQQEGCLADYVEVGMVGMWEAGKNLGDKEICAKWYSDNGFDGDKILSASDDKQIKQKLIDDTSIAAERGAFGIPMFFVNEDMFFGKDRLWQVEELLAKS